MSCEHLHELLAYSRIEPLPDSHFDAAQICSVIHNHMMGERGRIAKVGDYYPKPGRPDEKTEGPAGERPTAEACAGVLGRKYAENHAAALKRIALMGT